VTEESILGVGDADGLIAGPWRGSGLALYPRRGACGSFR
jgi:hypothetical protein